MIANRRQGVNKILRGYKVLNYTDEMKQKRTVLIMLRYVTSLDIPGLAEASSGGGRRKIVEERKKTEGKDQNETSEIIFQ